MSLINAINSFQSIGASSIGNNNIKSLGTSFLSEENAVEENKSSGGMDFAKILSESLEKVNQKQVSAEEKTIGFIEGDGSDVSEIMVEQQEAAMSLQLAVQVRNKLLEAYQEISRISL